MSNLENRIKAIEKQSNPDRPPRFLICYAGDEFGECNGVKTTRAEFESTMTDKDAVIVIEYASDVVPEN
jgi:hypothetical protein